MAAPGDIYRAIKLRLRLKRHCLWPYRHYLIRHPIRSALYLPHFVLVDREITNFTYDISNAGEIPAFLSACMQVDASVPARYVEELQNDSVFRQELRTQLQNRRDRNPEPKFGRRIGWYSIVRMIKPKLIVETGTHDGLGAAVLARALQRNRQEGSDGHLFTLDLDAQSGWLLTGEWKSQLTRILGDTRETLARAISGKMVDLFIHDSNHSYEHEMFEFTTVLPHMGDRAVLISDNAHVSSAMKDFCSQHGLPFAFFREKPARHFYHGAGIGLCCNAGLQKLRE